MNPHGKRARLGGILAAVAAALALVALPGVAAGHRHHDSAADAGTIQSFNQESGVLVIDLSDGGSVSGLVTRRTHIRCDNGLHLGRHGLRDHKRGHRASASRRDGSEGEDEADGDHGGPGLEPGDDHGGRGLEPGGGNHAAGDDSPGHHRGRHGRCTTDALTAGATVKIAELVLVDGKAIYKAVVLPKQAPADEGEEETEASPTE